MSVKSKAASAAGFMVLALALGMMFHLRDRGLRDGDNVSVVMTITFEPAIRDRPVIVVASVNGKPLLADGPMESPWQEQRYVARGSVVTLVATQAEKLPLSCHVKTGSGPGKPAKAAEVPGRGLWACTATEVA